MLVVGGYNSSNTCNLARICAEKVPTYHIADPECMISADEIRHRPVGAPSTTVGHRGDRPATGCPRSGRIVVGLTAGASTPNNIVGEVIQRLERSFERLTAGPTRRAHRSMSRAPGGRIPTAYPDAVPAFSGQEAVEIASGLDHDGRSVAERKISFFQLVVGRGDLTVRLASSRSDAARP